MDVIWTIISSFLEQLQKPTLSFLIAGMVLAALGSKFEIPAPVYQFIVILLLLKVGLGAGIAIREAEPMTLIVPALGAVVVGVLIVWLGGLTLARLRGVSQVDGLATAGLFGAVSASTLAAGMVMLDDSGQEYEAYIGALYPFMDIAALVTAILLARLAAARNSGLAVQGGGALALHAGQGGVAVEQGSLVRHILVDTCRSPAISAMLAGLAIGFLARPDVVYHSFYEPLFRGLLSILMMIMGMEAWSRLSALRKVAHVYVFYGLTAPLIHGFIGFGVGMAAHHLTGFSAGGVVLLAVMASSSSDISGPPTLRAALPEANSSAYVGTSTALGTPTAILLIPLWIALAELVISG
ncbi:MULTISPECIES: sodium-dependent bicarbonate transport family permease [Yoonia]|jgi:hypothetical protein|uniref:Sodium-dependent bicarbonate transport family permease n=1 Tax=Yoonia vestfoldensis SKA53 TaxID=314232 RepID=A3V725_9RHOB|nr:sodium-dependent bicarbonate transport family permease [Yoonia vestfoldensis]EAQ06041.1 hypothetical protein SKA53_08046 [Yoonia vestfoldensis SKA53]